MLLLLNFCIKIFARINTFKQKCYYEKAFNYENNLVAALIVILTSIILFQHIL